MKKQPPEAKLNRHITIVEMYQQGWSDDAVLDAAMSRLELQGETSNDGVFCAYRLEGTDKACAVGLLMSDEQLRDCQEKPDSVLSILGGDVASLTPQSDEQLGLALTRYRGVLRLAQNAHDALAKGYDATVDALARDSKPRIATMLKLLRK